jgi:signal transduction histidine kinase
MNGRRVAECSETRPDVAIEARPYGPSSSPEEVAALRSRVFWIADSVILFHEVPIETRFSLDVLFDQVESLTANHDRVHWLVDLTEARRPSAEARSVIKARTARLRPKLDRVAFVVGGNIIIRAAARTVAHMLGLPPVTIHSTRQEGVAELLRRGGSVSRKASRAEVSKDKAEAILDHLADIGAGTCTISETQVATEPDLEMRQILSGLLVLHGDLQYARLLHERADAERERMLTERAAAIAARDDFLAVASHELRTPITTLSLQLESLDAALRRPVSMPIEPLLEERLGRLRRQVTRLSDLVTEMLDVSSITSGIVSLHEDIVDLGQLTREVCDRFADELARKCTRLSLDIVDPVIGVWDASRLDQVLSNLIANAIKYGDGKAIEISVWSSNRWAHVSVLDYGIGISKEDQERIFTQFSRAVSSQHISGLGLGLWIAQQIVHFLGGRIRVESDLGMGARFTVDLPLRRSCSPS